MKKGYVQLYTGNGKGKTTAALGLALRGAGAGLKTIMIQFMKGQHYSELDAVEKFSGLITIEQYGSPDFCVPGDEDALNEHRALVKQGYQRAETALTENYDIVILDEIVTTTLFRILTVDDIIALIEKKPETAELILTGRGADPGLIDRVDLATEMVEKKHYFEMGVHGRRGIEF